MHAEAPIPDLRVAFNPAIPDFVANAIQKMMAKKPEDRFQSIDEVWEALDEREPAAPHKARGVGLTKNKKAKKRGRGRRLRRRRRPKSNTPVALVVAVLITIVAILLVVTFGGK